MDDDEATQTAHGLGGGDGEAPRSPILPTGGADYAPTNEEEAEADGAAPAARTLEAMPTADVPSCEDALRVGEVWRARLQALAQTLKCPICLG